MVFSHVSLVLESAAVEGRTAGGAWECGSHCRAGSVSLSSGQLVFLAGNR